jgi:putative ABC transport system permease protein
MFNNYLKVAFRSLLKNPFFFGLNIAGLGLGLAVALLLMLHVRQELAFDRYHSKVDHVYRVVLNTFFDPTKPGMLANAPNAVAPTMKESIPAVEQSARLLRHEFGKSASVVAGDNKLVETKLFWADPSLIDILDVPVVAGDLRTALTQPNFIALSRSTAVRYFGTANPVGQIVKIDRMDPFEVKAVFEDFPGNSSMDINVLGAFANIKWANNRLTWSNSSFETWVLLNPSANRQHVEAQMAAMIEKNVVPERRRYSMWLQPLRDVHLYSTAMDNNYAERLGDPKQVSILGILALAVLLIACFNYMNLSTARAQTRFQEVGINKTMGATRSQLALRFYVETLVVTMAALVMALGLLYVGIPTYSSSECRWQP